MENFNDEIWKDIPNYEGWYKVSNYGRIKSLIRNTNNQYRKTERILKINTSGKYYRICLYKDSIKKYYLVHRLVWEAFNGPIPEGMQVNHINEVKTDNRLLNLNLMTCKENINWGTATERRTIKRSKRVIQLDLNGNFIKEYTSLSNVGRETSYYFQNISKCCLGKIPTAYGYIWKYKND